MKQMKKRLAVILAAVLLLTLIPAFALAEEIKTPEGNVTPTDTTPGESDPADPAGPDNENKDENKTESEATQTTETESPGEDTSTPDTPAAADTAPADTQPLPEARAVSAAIEAVALAAAPVSLQALEEAGPIALLPMAGTGIIEGYLYGSDGVNTHLTLTGVPVALYQNGVKVKDAAWMIPDVKYEFRDLDDGAYTLVAPGGSYVDSLSGTAKPYDDFSIAVTIAGGGMMVQDITMQPYSGQDVPTGLTANAGDKQVALGWNAVTGAAGYNIYMDGGAAPVNTTPVSGTEYSVTGLENGKKYTFTVTAVVNGKESAKSTPVTATPALPAPTGLFAVAGAGSVTLYWDRRAGATGYNVYMDGGETPENSAPVTDAAYTVTGLTPGRSYTFAVSALDGGSESGKSKSITVEIPDENTSTAASLADLYGPPYQLTAGLQLYHSPDLNDPARMLAAGEWVQPLETNLPPGWTRVFVNNMTYYIPLSQKTPVRVSEVEFDSEYGYVLGDEAIISAYVSFWPRPVSAGAGQYVIIQFYDNGKLQHTETALLANNAGLEYDPPADYGANTLLFSYKSRNMTLKQHDDLTVYVIVPGTAEYTTGTGVGHTFVDAGSDGRRTTIEATYPVEGMQAGVESTINITVFTHQKEPVQTGKVTVTLDGEDYDVDIVDGVAKFTHVYAKAGADIEFTYAYAGGNTGTPDKSRTDMEVFVYGRPSEKTETKMEIFVYGRPSEKTETKAVAKGTPTVTVTQDPPNTVVRVTNTIHVTVDGMAVGSTPRYIDLKFYQNGVLQHTIWQQVTENTDTSGVATIEYAYIKTYETLTLRAELVADNDYNAASGTTQVIVSAA